MPHERLSMRKIREVLRLRWEQGLSHRQIVASCRLGQGTVGEYLRRAAAAGLTWPLPEDLTDAELERRLFPPPEAIPAAERPLPEWATVHRELRKKGVTLYSIGVGGSRPIDVPVPADDGIGEAGWALRVPFTEATLRSVAAAGGGRYYRSQTGHDLLDAMRDLAARERRQIGWTRQTAYRDLYPYALGIAFVAACALLVTL